MCNVVHGLQLVYRCISMYDFALLWNVLITIEGYEPVLQCITSMLLLAVYRLYIVYSVNSEVFWF